MLIVLPICEAFDLFKLFISILMFP